MALSQTAKKRLAGRLRSLLERKYGTQIPAPAEEPIDTLVLTILEGSDVTRSRAQKALHAIQKAFVDWNEVRVSPVAEIAGVIGAAGDCAYDKAAAIRAALNDICRSKHKLSLLFLREESRSNARQYLSSLAGVDRRASTAVMLICLDVPVLPLDDAAATFFHRLGLLDTDRPTQKARMQLENLLGKEALPAVHMYVAEEARTTCREDSPDCASCLLRLECSYFKSTKAKRRRKSSAKSASTKSARKTRSRATSRKTKK